MGVAVGLPPPEPLARQGIRCPVPPPSRSDRGAEGCEAGCPPARCNEGGQLPHLPPFVRDTPAGTGAEHPHHPGATRPQGWKQHHDLRAWASPRSARRTRPSRHSVSGRTDGSGTREPRLAWYSVLGAPLQDKELQGMAHWMPPWFSERSGRQALVHTTVQ